MATKPKSQPCPFCGGNMRFERRSDVLVHRGQETRIKTQGFWCTGCGEAIFDAKALSERERAFLEFKAEVDNVLGPAEVAAVRKKLGLSQRKAGELIGGGPRSFQKYESGKQAVSVPMSHLLRLLGHDPRRLREIAPDGAGPRGSSSRRARSSGR
jgi:HTH-type transcriptional regulator/antitoxin MqsA